MQYLSAVIRNIMQEFQKCSFVVVAANIAGTTALLPGIRSMVKSHSYTYAIIITNTNLYW